MTAAVRRAVKVELGERSYAMVAALAWKIHCLAPQSARVQLEDLQQEGLLALLKKAREYDPSRGTTLEQFARARVEGAMKDLLRSQHVLPDLRSKRPAPVEAQFEGGL